MTNHVVHFEIIGTGPAALRAYYSDLFGWSYDVGDAASPNVSEPGQYGFATNAGLNGGVAGGPSLDPKVVFYVGVDDVGAALDRAEELGGRRIFGPDGTPGVFMVGQFADPEGNVIGVAGSK